MRLECKRAVGALMAVLRWCRRNLTGILGGTSVVLNVILILGLSGILHKQHESQLEFCTRSNAARVSSVKNLRGDVHTLKAELALWVAVREATPATAAAPNAVERAFNRDLAALRIGIGHKEKAVRTSIAAQASVAIKPGSPVVDCSFAYP